jgi:positive regulator of sigma E activity
MDFMSLLFIFVSVTLFLGTETFWYIQRFYRIAVLFAALQLTSAYLAIEYFQINLQQLPLVMLGYFAIAVFSTFLRFRARIKNASFVKV